MKSNKKGILISLPLDQNPEFPTFLTGNLNSSEVDKSIKDVPISLSATHANKVGWLLSACRAHEHYLEEQTN